MIVTKAAKKLVASSIEAKKTGNDATGTSLEAAIKRCATGDINATSVVPANEEATAKKELAQEQTALKLLSVKSRNNKLKKCISFSG